MYINLGEKVEIKEKKIRKSPNRIVFNICEEDHEIIKSMARSQKLTVRDWIIRALDKAVREQQGMI